MKNTENLLAKYYITKYYIISFTTTEMFEKDLLFLLSLKEKINRIMLTKNKNTLKIMNSIKEKTNRLDFNKMIKDNFFKDTLDQNQIDVLSLLII